MNNLNWVDPADTAANEVLAIIHHERISQNDAIIRFLISDSAASIFSDSEKEPEALLKEPPPTDGADSSDRAHISWKIAVADDFSKARSIPLGAVAVLFDRFCIFDYLDRNAEVLMGRTGAYLVNNISSRIGLPKD